MGQFDLVIYVPFNGSEEFQSRLLRHLSANDGENIRVQVKPMNGDDRWETLSLFTRESFVSTQSRDA